MELTKIPWKKYGRYLSKLDWFLKIMAKELEEISPAGSTISYLGYKKFLLAKQQTNELLEDTLKMAVSKRHHK